jgi:hypothetical protein
MWRAIASFIKYVITNSQKQPFYILFILSFLITYLVLIFNLHIYIMYTRIDISAFLLLDGKTSKVKARVRTIFNNTGTCIIIIINRLSELK